jgi:hypothetical protein
MKRHSKKDATLAQYLGRNRIFNREAIRNYYASRGELLDDPHLRVIVSRLKKKGVLGTVGRNLYKLQDKKVFSPEIDAATSRIARLLNRDFPFLENLIWSSQWLNELTTLQLMRSIIIVEVEAGSAESVFLHLKDLYPGNVFWDPGESEWEKYRSQKENIIVKAMISESPAMKSGPVRVASLEKILVDIYCDKIWRPIFSSELENIYAEACGNYTINYTKLLSYSARRNKKKEIWDLIKLVGGLDLQTIEMIEK